MTVAKVLIAAISGAAVAQPLASRTQQSAECFAISKDSQTDYVPDPAIRDAHHKF
jgi:hypothetical protein